MAALYRAGVFTILAMLLLMTVFVDDVSAGGKWSNRCIEMDI